MMNAASAPPPDAQRVCRLWRNARKHCRRRCIVMEAVVVGVQSSKHGQRECTAQWSTVIMGDYTESTACCTTLRLGWSCVALA